MTKSTKPFRRARDLFLVTIYLWSVNIWFGACRAAARLTHSEFEIDPLQSPTLHRAHRILYTRDGDKRQIEVLAKLDALEAEVDSKMEKAEATHEQEMHEKRTKHQEGIEAWLYEFDAPDRAAKALKLAELEKRRQELYAHNRNKEIQAAQDYQMSQWRKAEKDYHAAHLKWQGQKYYVTVHEANIRSNHTLHDKILRTVKQGEEVYINGWLTAASIYNNDTWLRVREGGWLWSGALVLGNNDPVTIKWIKENLENLNEYETTSIRNMSGEVLRTVVDSPKPTQHYQGSRPANGKKGDVWYDTSNNYKMYQFDGTAWVIVTPNPPQHTLNAGIITSSHINAGKITADRIVIDSSGLRIQQAGGLTAPRETAYIGLPKPPEMPNQLDNLRTETQSLRKQADELMLQKQKLKRERDDMEAELRRQRQENDRQQAMNLMNNTINTAIQNMYIGMND